MFDNDIFTMNVFALRYIIIIITEQVLEFDEALYHHFLISILCCFINETNYIH